MVGFDAARFAIPTRNVERQYPAAARKGGLTQENLAENADIATRTVQFIEAAQFGASLAVLIRLRRALDCRWDLLLAEID